MKKLLFFISIIAFTINVNIVNAQHLFSISQNDLSKESISRLKSQVFQSEIPVLSMTKTIENRDVYSVSFLPAQNRKIVILNEQTGSHVVITPVEPSRTEFQLAPFFIEELKQGALGNASQFLVFETTSDFSVRNLNAVNVPFEKVYIPKYFYGKKEDVKEALPKDRQIVHIFKQKPQLILAFPNDPELQRYAAQYEEENSYYVYMYKLPDGTLCTYDEHFNPVPEQSEILIGEQLQFTLTGNLNATQQAATEYALGLWSEKLQGTVPVKINVDSKNLGNPYIIGQSTPMQQILHTGQFPELPTLTYFPGSLWNQLVGYAQAPGINIKLEMNSTFNFYYGTTGNPSYSQTDWVTVMLHESLHGLGFSSTCDSDGRYYYVADDQGNGYYTSFPCIFHRQLYQGATGNVCFTDLNQTQRAALMISNNLYAGAPGSNLLSAHGGNRVKMYAPNPWQPGSSVSHWNNNPGFTTFMEYSISPGWKWHNIGTREMGILKDMGWKEYDPNAIFVNFKPNGGEGSMSTQQYSIGSPQYLKANMFTKTGYKFKNWNDLANGTGPTTYQDQQLISISADVTLYAQWEGNKYTLTFNPGANGTVEITEMSVTYGQPLGELPVPKKQGFAFKEWRIGPKPIDEDYVWDYEENQVAEARWEMITHTITATATPGGTISSPGDFQVLEGSNKTYNIKPDKDFFISDVLVDNVSAGAVPKYIFENVVASHTIHAVFTNIGINETDFAKSVQIFPNPTTGQLRIETSDMRYEISEIEIYDMIGGKLISNLKSQISNQTIDISHLSAGIYFLKIQTEKGTVMKKIIKL